MIPVFDGAFLRLVLAEHDRDHLFITFDHLSKGRDGFGGPDNASIFERRGWSSLRVLAARNDWFLNHDLPAALDAAATVAARFVRTTTYGFSMGGYGALRFAQAVGAARAVAISPQASPVPLRTPFESRWRAARAAVDASLDDFGALDAHRTEIITVHDPRIAPDNAHVRLLSERLPGLVALLLPFGGHPATRVIREGGRLGVFTAELLTGPVDRASALAHHKRARRHSDLYQSARRSALQARSKRHDDGSGRRGMRRSSTPEPLASIQAPPEGG